MDQIDIGTVLNKLNDTVDVVTQVVKTYGIRFINDRGEKREFIFRKNVKSPKQVKIATDPAGKEMYNLQRNGVILLKNPGEDHPRSIKTCMIYGFKDFNSSTWLKVFH
jgi:hypothetical protein